MKSHLKTMRVVFVAANDVSQDAEAAMAAIKSEAAISNEEAEAAGERVRVEVIQDFLTEANFASFSPISPRTVCDAARVKYNLSDNDAIICVFWRRFATDQQTESVESEQIEAEFEKNQHEWESAGYPRILLFFCEKEQGLSKQWFIRESKSTFVDEFRQSKTFAHACNYTLDNRWWWGYKNQRQLQQIIRNQLRYLSQQLNASEDASARQSYNCPNIELPEGWIWGGNAIKELSGELSPMEAEQFFDGMSPTWKQAVSSSIPRRVLVEELEGKISKAAQDGQLRVTLLIGPGGEGKSTMLYQLAVDLTKKHQGIYVIWRNSNPANHKNSPLSLNLSFIEKLLDYKQGSFVIVSDDAEYIAQNVFDVANFVRQQPRKNVQFLLASRRTDWRWQQDVHQAPADYEWQRMLDRNYDEQSVRNLKPEDARRIVNAWKDAGALGEFGRIPEEDRALTLSRYAEEEESSNEGSFLGAMLLARKNKTLASYVEGILLRLKDREAFPERQQKDIVLPRITLKGAFAYVVALHADNYYLLNFPILQQVLSCSPEQLDEKVIRPLADEAAIDPSRLVLARHRAIAEKARDILAQEIGFEEKYRDLALAARKVWLNNRKNAEMTQWNRLPRDYDNRKKIGEERASALVSVEDSEEKAKLLFMTRHFAETAIALAQGLMEAEPDDAMAVSRYANILRIGGNAEAAVEVCRRKYNDSLKMTRKGYFTEWAACETAVGNHYTSVWLLAIEISDCTSRLQQENPIIFQASLTRFFENIYNKPHIPSQSDKQLFLTTCIAASQLGYLLKDNPDREMSSRETFEQERSEHYLSAGEKLRIQFNYPMQSPSEAIDNLLKGIKRACELRNEYEEDSNGLDLLPDFTRLSFKNLYKLFGVSTDPETSGTQPSAVGQTGGGMVASTPRPLHS